MGCTTQVRAAHRLGQVYYAISDFGRAAELLRRNVEVADRAFSTPSMEWRIQSRAWLARTLSALGAFAEGWRHGEEAFRLAATEGRGEAPMVAHGCLSQTGRREQARTAMAAAIDLYRAMDMTFWLPQAEAALGEVEGH
jgi:hypothetical protein